RQNSTQGTKNDIIEVVACHVDIDFKDTPPEVADQRLKQLDNQPTLIVHSGNGYHAYWFLEKSFPIVSMADVDEIESINYGLARLLGGDATHDIARVLRTPGGVNSKYLHKPMCKAHEDSITALYTLNQLAKYATQAPVTERKVDLQLGNPVEAPARFGELLAKDNSVKNTWEGNRPDLKDGSRSAYDMAMA